MFTTRHLRRAAALFAVACAIVPAASSVAQADKDPLARPHSYLSYGTTPQMSAALEKYYASEGAPKTSAAPAQGEYYASYGTPEPLSRPRPVAPSHDGPWLAIALAGAGALTLVAAGATHRRRLRVRRRRAARAAA